MNRRHRRREIRRELATAAALVAVATLSAAWAAATLAVQQVPSAPIVVATILTGTAWVLLTSYGTSVMFAAGRYAVVEARRARQPLPRRVVLVQPPQDVHDGFTELQDRIEANGWVEPVGSRELWTPPVAPDAKEPPPDPAARIDDGFLIDAYEAAKAASRQAVVT